MKKTKQKRDSGKHYNEEEIKCMKDYLKKNGPFKTYTDAEPYAKHHEEKTGRERQASALYMFGRRVLQGKYD